MADSIADVLKTKQGLSASIESNSKNYETANASIEMPEQIRGLITGSEYWILAKSNRYKKLIREGHLNALLELARVAATKDHPDWWFAKVCSVKKWERTLKFVAQLRAVAEQAAEVIKRLEVQPAQVKAVYKACWRFKDSVVRNAITAQETGRSDKFKYFCWLMWSPKVGSSVRA